MKGNVGVEADYAARRLPTDPETFDGYVVLTNPAALDRRFKLSDGDHRQ